MRLFAKVRPARRPAAVRTASNRVVEMLESRTMLNATLSSAIGPVNLTPASAGTTVDLNAHFVDPNVTGTAVLFQTSQGNIPVTLFNSQVPTTVNNFLHYVNLGEYNGTFIHRVVTPTTGGISIVQGGGYTPNQTHIHQDSPIALEGSMPNSTGTLAMARTSTPNSATTEWFFNYGDDSSTLPPGTSNGYAVFGKVLYNGLAPLTATAALPLQDYPPTFVSSGSTPPSVPVMNFTGGTVTAANLVMVPSIAVVPALTYSATSDNPSILSASTSGSGLVLTPGSGTGIANVTVTATDLGGNVATTTFQVGVGVTLATPLNTALGAGGAKQIRFTDADGTVTTLMLTGPGSATLNMNGAVASQTLAKNKILTVTGTGLSIASINATGTTSASALTITGHGGNGVVELGGLATDGALKTLNAHNTDFAGNTTINGGVGSVNILSGSSGALSATAIGHMVVKGAFAENLSAASIASFTAGSITGGTWSVSGNAASVTAGNIANWTANFGTLGKLTSKTSITNSVVHSAGNVGSVAASTLTGSTIFAGVAALPGGQTLPAAASDFAASASITSLRTKTFVNSDVAAQTLGRFTLGQVTTANGGTPFGVVGHTLQALTATSAGKTLRLKNVTGAAEVSAALTASGFAAADFLVQIV